MTFTLPGLNTAAWGPVNNAALQNLDDRVTDLEAVEGVSTGLDEKVRQALTFYYPEDYGAVGDSVTNDHDAIQAAIDAAKAAGGGIVWITKRYGWRGTLIHRGGVVVYGTGVRRVLVTDDHLDRGLVALDSTAVYQYGAWGSGSVDDNPGPVANLNIDGNGVGGTTTALFQMQCVDGAIVDSRIVNSAGNAVEVGGSQNSAFDRCVIGYSSGRAISFMQTGGQGAGQVKFNNCYVSDSDVLLYMDGDSSYFPSHDITFNQCLFELHVGGNDIADLRAGDTRFVRCVFTNSNAGTLPNDSLVKISQDTYPAYSTTVAFDTCWWNGGSNATKPTAAVWIKAATGGVGNIVSFSGMKSATNVQALYAVEGTTVANTISVEGPRFFGAGVNAFSTAPGGSLFGVFNLDYTPRRWSIPDDSSGSLNPPIMIRRLTDTFDRYRQDRDGTQYWFDGSASTVRASKGRNATDNAMDLGGLWRFQNGIVHRGIVVANVTTAGQAVALSAATTSSPLQIIQFTVTGSSGNVTISGGLAGSYIEVILDASTLTTGQTATVSWSSDFDTAASSLPQPVQGKKVIAGFRLYGSKWTESYRNTGSSTGSYVPTSRTLAGLDLSADRSASDIKTALAIAVGDVSGAAPLASPTFTGNPTVPTASPGDNDTTIANTAFVTAAIAALSTGTTVHAGTTATAAATAAKTATISGYTPAAGDLLALTLTNGNTVASPTLNINSGGAKSIYLAGGVATLENVFSGANAVWLMQYDGTRWNLVGPQSDFTQATTAQMQAGTSNTVSWMTPALVAAGITQLAAITASNAQSGSSYTFALTDVGKRLESTGSAAFTLTIPTNASVALPLYVNLPFEQYGTGQITVAGAAGVTLHTASSYTTRAQYSVGNAYQRAANEWIISGDMT